MVLFALLIPDMSVAAGEKKKVLLLHSYHQGFFWTDEITRGVRDELKDTNTKLYIEYMDTKHHLEPGVLDLLEDLIAYKHKLYGYDLIISSDNNAYNFVMKIRQDTFADIPYVFCGVNNPPSLGKRDRHNISGIHERIDIMGNIQLIRNLHPKCERIIIPVDNTPTGEAILEEINSLGFGNSLYDGISIETVTGFTFDELIQRLRAATPPDVVLMTVLFRDWNNDFLEYDKQTLLVMENTDVPVYASWDFNIGYGVVGGRVVCGYDQGTAAARKALHFLQGTHADEIPMQFETPTRLMLDYNQLKRFGIDTNPLIAEADIVNKPVTFYDRYSVLIWQAGAIILLLMAALAGVLLSLLRVHRANARVKESEDSLRTTLDSIGDGVIATDLSGRIVRMNPVAEKLTGWKISDAVGKDLNDVFRISDIETGMAAENPADKVLQENTITTIAKNTMLLSRNGSYFRISDSAAPIKDLKGKTTGVVLVFRDITEEYSLETQLRQSQKMEAIGQLAGGIAHDFNNMLTGIMGSADVLRSCYETEGESEKYLSMIIESANRAADLSAKLLSFSRRQPAEYMPVDLHQAIHNSISIIQNTVDRRIIIQTDLTPDAVTVLGDITQLQTVFLNLGINAVHAMPEGGKLTFHSTIVELSDEYCSSSPFELSSGSFVQVEVCDTGMGIPHEYIDRIFEPFFTTKEQGQGTGLGLSTVYGIVRQLSGEVKVYSIEGEGCCFHVLVPLAENKLTEMSDLETSVPGTGVILLVDDEQIIRYTAKRILSSLGYDVLVARNGEEAIEIFKSNSDEIDLVLLDMIMPLMNGRDCFFKLRKIRPDIRVLLSTGFIRDEDLRTMLDNGLDGIIQKPFRTRELSQKIAEILEQNTV